MTPDKALEFAIAAVKAEAAKNAMDKFNTAQEELKQALRALSAMYHLSGDLKKPSEHKPTRDALRLAENALYGYASTP